MVNGGKVIILPMKKNTQIGFDASFPIKDAQGRNIVSYVTENGKQYIEVYTWNGASSFGTSYEVQALVHTHPLGVAGKEPNKASAPDLANAAAYPGIQFFIINDNNIVEYSATNPVISTNVNNCK